AVDRLLGRLDEQARLLGVEQVASCRGRARGEVSDAQLAARRACYQRRAIEVGAFVHEYVTAPRDLVRAERAAQLLRWPQVCSQMDIAPPSASLAQLTALWERYASWDRTPADRAVEHVSQIAQEAAAAGDHELATRAELSWGMSLRNRGDYAG